MLIVKYYQRDIKNLSNIILPPFDAIENVRLTPPKAINPWIMAARRPIRITRACKTSVHMTAFIPPYC